MCFRWRVCGRKCWLPSPSTWSPRTRLYSWRQHRCLSLSWCLYLSFTIIIMWPKSTIFIDNGCSLEKAGLQLAFYHLWHLHNLYYLCHLYHFYHLYHFWLLYDNLYHLWHVYYFYITFDICIHPKGEGGCRTEAVCEQLTRRQEEIVEREIAEGEPLL